MVRSWLFVKISDLRSSITFFGKTSSEEHKLCTHHTFSGTVIEYRGVDPCVDLPVLISTVHHLSCDGFIECVVATMAHCVMWYFSKCLVYLRESVTFLLCASVRVSARFLLRVLLWFQCLLTLCLFSSSSTYSVISLFTSRTSIASRVIEGLSSDQSHGFRGFALTNSCCSFGCSGR